MLLKKHHLSLYNMVENAKRIFKFTTVIKVHQTLFKLSDPRLQILVNALCLYQLDSVVSMSLVLKCVKLTIERHQKGIKTLKMILFINLKLSKG